MLTELQVKNAKQRKTSYMVRDDRGLYLLTLQDVGIGFCVTGKTTRSINCRYFLVRSGHE